MDEINNIEKKAGRIPEFSDKNYGIASYVVASLITLSGLFFIYEILVNSDLTFKAQWNMFKSPLGNLCMGIGIICALIFWGKMGHWTRIPVFEERDSFGNVKRVYEDMNLTNQLLYRVLFPFLGHFVIEPIIYGAIIYYPIQCIIAIVGSIFPYVLSLIVLAIIAVTWIFAKNFQFRYRSIALVLAGLLFTGAFAWGGYAIEKAAPSGSIEMFADTQNSTIYDVTESENMDSEDEAIAEEDEDDQFEGVGEEGLYGCLPEGIIDYTGDMEGFPIEFRIIKSADMGNIAAVYKNVKYGTTMNLTGESMPADGGNISFYGKDGDTYWTFVLSGDCENITGTAQSGDTELDITLHIKLQ